MESIQFEGVKLALRQSKDGYVLNLAIHPDEIPGALVRDYIGSRYMVVMVRLGDDEQPLDRDNEFPGDAAVRDAGILCRDPVFWEYILDTADVEITSEEDAAKWIQDFIGIASRKELKNNLSARDLFNTIKDGFNKWKG